MKPETQPSNHNIWTECSICGKEYDARLHSGACPECGAHTTINYKSFVFSALSVLVLILLTLVSVLLASEYISR